MIIEIGLYDFSFQKNYLIMMCLVNIQRISESAKPFETILEICETLQQSFS